MNAESIIFFILAAFVIVFSILTVTTKRIIRSATFLLFVLFGVAGFYFLLGYTFLGAVQVMVYAGGIVVLYVFSILLTSGSDEKESMPHLSKIVASVVSCLAGGAIMLFIILNHKFASSLINAPSELDIKKVGQAMLSFDKYGYILPFEAVGVFLLACIVGGLLIARKH